MSNNPLWRHGRASLAPPVPSPSLRPDGWRERLEALAARLSRLSPDGWRPDRYAEEKSEIVAGMRRLARER
jgi:hypothetical protein